MRLLAPLALLVPLAAAAAGDPADLPPVAEVRAAIDSYPSVLAAEAAVAASQAQRRGLNAGPYETQMRLGAGKRRERTLDQDMNEYELGVERAFRIGSKSELDQSIGDAGVAQARLGVGDAMHEAARSLLRLWFAWMRAAAQGEDWDAQAQILSHQLEIVDKRVGVGDAPRRERLLAESAFAQADTMRLQTRMRAEAARAELTRSFPTIAPPAALPQVMPQPLAHDLAWWRERVLEHNHELAMARAEAERQRLLASRADAERTPDPTLGLRYLSERDDTERVLGVVVTVPFSGAARRAAADSALAQGDVAAQREAAVLRRLGAEVAALYANASHALGAAERAASAADGLRRNAELAARAYALGESSLADVLVAQRFAIEARLTATLARLDAAESRYRLMLDAHELWPLDAPN
jgi:cobalt-zinc-cadmium efflux system outer membrane protein